MSLFDSISVAGDFVSEHYLDERFPTRVRELRKAWSEREDSGADTARKGVLAFATGFGRDLSALRERRSSADRADALRVLSAKVRAALCLDREPETLTFDMHGSTLLVEGVAHRTSSGLHLVVLTAQDAASVEDVLDGENAGKLLRPAIVEGREEPVTSRVISNLFLSDEPPALVLVHAGGWLLLAERERWPEGRWLAVDLATVAERRDTKVAGEVETVAALFGADSLLPEADGSCALLTVLADSVQHAVGVSKDLREGVRESVEIVANEVVTRRRERGLPVEGVDDLARQLTRQSLRLLYRVLFLLYAEARPELGILPVDSPEYAEGYGLDRLRELALVELENERSRRGTHLYESLHRLFTLVDRGHEPVAGSEDDGGGLRFEALRADLFADGAISLIDGLDNVNEDSSKGVFVGIGLGNDCVQQVLRKLLLSKEVRGQDRGFVSYAQLGINQLGAVYEGLMSYTGFFADQELYEVAKGGDPSKGTWVVSAEQARELEAFLVRRKNEVTGELEPVRHPQGSFVFRLSGRERQRSASYYTPEVLTRCVVKHSLAELLGEEHDKLPARQILDLTVCEPALGSGAFLIEAVNQLADAYLKRAQAERGEAIPPEQYPAELQKVKAYLSLHQCYGVDLNATAVELAEVTLWLNAMHPGLRAPWFGLHLQRGNSLIGARRAVYKPVQYAKAWLKEVPEDLPLGTELPEGRVHHFLLPAQGWGAVAGTKEAKELAPDAVAELKEWRKGIRKAPDKKGRDRLAALGRRVEVLWDLARRRLEIAEAEARRDVRVWGADDLPKSSGAVSREQIEATLSDEDGAYRRLRRVMDAWAALWFWPLTVAVQPPNWEQWLDALEKLLGFAGRITKEERRGQTSIFVSGATWTDLDEAEAEQRDFAGMRAVADVLREHPWLHECEDIATREGFFHWELDFAGVFARGGFDLQVGNPPWVRPKWEDSLILAEADAWFGVTNQPLVEESADRRCGILNSEFIDRYLDERASNAGMAEHLGSETDRPVLTGLRPDLYRCFMERTWRSMSPCGIIGLIHPESHFTEARAGRLRRGTYRRLRRHWQFQNAMKLFEEVTHKSFFGVHVYGVERNPVFLNAASLYHPDTVDRSRVHNGAGPEPGLKDDADQWDVRPHRNRVIVVDHRILANWAELLDEPGTHPESARMVRSVNRSSQAVLRKLATAPRFVDVGFEWSSGWDEAADRRRGFFRRSSAISNSWDDVIVQGPHFAVSTPLAKQPNETMRSQGDYASWDLENASERAIPRTNYQRSVTTSDFIGGYRFWNGVSSVCYWRLFWRNMVDPSTVRTLHGALFPPGPTHVHAVHSMATESALDLALLVGVVSSLPADFLAKVGGATSIPAEFVGRLPHPKGHPLVREMILRTLRLNCLTRDYEALWSELFEEAWRLDEWTHDRADRPAMGEVSREWTMGTPLRTAFDRRQALVEIDALAAIMLNITADELCTIYRTQFGVLRKYERVMHFDANGREVPKDVMTAYDKDGERADLGRYVLPFQPVDREKEMTRAHEVFTERLVKRG